MMEPRSFYVYIVASSIGGTLYIGVTNDLIRSVAEHKLKNAEAFQASRWLGWSISNVSRN